MKIGFIGAGRVGFSVGKYLSEKQQTEAGAANGGIHADGERSCITDPTDPVRQELPVPFRVMGYYSRSPESSAAAARFTGTKQYATYQELVGDCDVVFLTVNDSAIAPVWEQIRTCPISGKLICHCSGALSSEVFSGITQQAAYGYSIHPLLAVNDRYHSYRELSTAFFTIEGTKEKLPAVLAFVRSLGNQAAVIDSGAKMRYHAAAAIASNLYVGLVDLSEEILADCGFTKEQAHEALRALIAGNTQNILEAGPAGALTGPVERNDLMTVREHLDCLDPREREIYRVVSKQVVSTAKKRNRDKDYRRLEGLLAAEE